ncbi:MAG: hypothetical protein H7145_13445 [Akkermansiaceae bacterium]|nr:hypothetical protein [Armatimonadota bacterium]
MNSEPTKRNRLQQAFQEQGNLLGLAGAAALSMALLNPLPLLIGVVAEAAYLLFVPDSQWYGARLSSRFDKDIRARRDALKADVFPKIGRDVQERFARLEAIREHVTNTEGLEGETWFREVLRKLDYLLEQFLRFALKESQFRQYLQNVYAEVVLDNKPSANPVPPPVIANAPNRRSWMPKLDDRDRTVKIRPTDATGYRSDNPLTADMAKPLPTDTIRKAVTAIQTAYGLDIEEIQAIREKEEDLNTQAVLDKRIEVVESRREHVEKIGRFLINLGHQMQLLEDSFGLINDQLRARSPEQVLADIEGVVTQTDGMTRLLEELAPMEEMSRRLSA